MNCSFVIYLSYPPAPVVSLGGKIYSALISKCLEKSKYDVLWFCWCCFPGDLPLDLIDRAFSRFRHKDVVHMSRLKTGLNVLELWHGPTYAFKDLSLSCTGQFLQYFLKKRRKHVTVLVGKFAVRICLSVRVDFHSHSVMVCSRCVCHLCSPDKKIYCTLCLGSNVGQFSHLL